MEIVLVRHAEPQWVVQGRAVADPALTELGMAQARSLATRLAAMSIDEILVSPVRRALETVEPLEQALRSTATIVAGLTEIHVPWDDTPSHVVEEAFRAARDRPLEQWWDGLGGGESFREFHLRVTEAVDALLRQRGVTRVRDQQQLWHDDGNVERIVVVAHGGTNAVMLGHLLGLDPTPWEWERFVLHHASITRIRTAPLAGAHIMSLWEANSTSHLSAEYLTR